MHRSGTSCLAGCLQEAGLALGEVKERSRWNPKGNRESVRIRELHEDLLRSSGGSWWEPPQAVRWSDAHRAERDAIIESFGAAPAWGFKDPRTLLVLDGWIEALPDLQPVGTFRHPLAVAASLRARAELDQVADPLALWADYNRRLLVWHERRPFPVVSFDADPADYARAVSAVATGLGLTPPATGPSFFEDELRAATPATDDGLSDEAAALHRRLLELAR